MPVPQRSPHTPQRPSAVRRRRRGMCWIAALGVAALPAVAAPSAWATLAAPPDAAAEAAAPVGTDQFAAGAARTLEEVRNDPARLRAFLRGMPKGADLHNHLSGAVHTTTLLRYAVEDGLCVNATGSAKARPCVAEDRPVSDTLTDRTFRKAVIGAWSMRGFSEHHGETGADHFFGTFGKFGAATTGRSGDMLAEAARDTYLNGALYLETLVTRQGAQTRDLATSIGYTPDLEALRRRILASPQWPGIVRGARNEIAVQLAVMRHDLRCGTAFAEPACNLQIRFDQQVGRAQAPEVVFTQLLLGFELAETDPYLVGVNLVQEESLPLALRDYGLHMRMLDMLRHHYRKAHITLHAGELTPRYVSPVDLSYHIRQAVEVGHAERIGHGVDIWWENRRDATLRTMARRHVLVEIALSSNRQILGVVGPAHPLRLYRAHGVPFALATDDPGVSWSSLTHEWEQGVTDQHLDYYALKRSARAALDHGFLQGASLWRAPDDFRPGPACRDDAPWHRSLSPTCARLLAGSPKAKTEWTQEERFHRFERRYAQG